MWMWNSCVKAVAYLIGSEHACHMCDHTGYKVKNVVLDKGEPSQSCTILENGEQPEQYHIYVLRGIAVCDICGIEFNTWANVQKKSEIGPDDISNYEPYDNWRDYDNFLPGAKRREIIPGK